jgi:hypothetical protein
MTIDTTSTDGDAQRTGEAEFAPAVATVQELAEAIAAAAPCVDERERRIVVSLYDLLAQSEPVSPAALAARATVDEALVEQILDSWPGVFRDGQDDAVTSGKSAPLHGVLHQPASDPPIPPALTNLEVGEPAPSSQ